MKKLLAMVLVFTLVLTMGTLAFAVDPGVSDRTSVEIKKNLNLENKGTVNPAETFTFTIGAGTGERDGKTITAPAFDEENFTIKVEKGGAEGTAEIRLPLFTQVGVYTYEVKETVGNTAGMIYDNGSYYLIVTVINNPEGTGFLRVLTLKNENNLKEEAFKNQYSAGNLTVKKEITGNYANPEDEFEITVTIKADEGKVINAEAIQWNLPEGSAPTVENGSYIAIYKLKGNESFTIQNLPYDVSYKVEETNSGKYTASYDENASGEFDQASIETTITNTRDTTIETGINLDNAPYIIILVGVAVGLVAFTMKKRIFNNK